MGAYDGGKLKAAQDSILDRIVSAAAGRPASEIKELCEAFSLLETATKE